MALTSSSMLPLGQRAPDFALPESRSGKILALSVLRAERATVIMFICNHCPYVKHVQAELVRLAHDYQPRGVSVIAISSNDAENYPEDGPDKMAQVAREWAYPFPYLYDESQAVARAYQAACTPDFYVFDASLLCVYRGQLDDSRPGNDRPVSGKDMRNAIDALIAGLPVSAQQLPSVGCNIKWLCTKNG